MIEFGSVILTSKVPAPFEMKMRRPVDLIRPPSEREDIRLQTRV